MLERPLPDPTLPTTKMAEDKQEWLVLGRARGDLQVAASQSPEASKGKATNSPISKGEALSSYASIHELFPLKRSLTLTPSKLILIKTVPASPAKKVN